MMEIITQLVLVLLFILLGGFFAASEYAVVALRKTRIDELVKKGDAIARLLQQALDNKQEYISATQLGTTIVSLMLGWVGEPVISRLFFFLFSFIPKGGLLVITHAVSVVAAFISLTFLSIIVGELVPKTIAIQKPELVGMFLIGPLTLFVKIFKPFISLLNKLGAYVLLLLKFKTTNENPLSYTKDELKIVLDQISRNGLIPKDEATLVGNVFKLSEKNINQMMTPRSEIVTINAKTRIEELRNTIDPRYSRFPVYKGSPDNIIGFIHVKDIYYLENNYTRNKRLSETNIIRKIINVPETKKANEILLDMRKKHVHLAMVYDEFGVIVGAVTLEDIIESLVGEIQDEFDKPVLNIKRNIDGSYVVDGNVSLEEIQKRFHLPITGQGYTTIGGLIFDLLGREPRVGDKIWIAHKSFEVKSVSGKRIKELLLKRNGFQHGKEKK